MSDAALDEKKIREAAADWFAQLNNTTVSTDALRAFREWRRDPRHDAAYRDVEALWRAAGMLRNDADIQKAAEEALERKSKKKRTGPLPRPGPRGTAAAIFAAVLAVGLTILWPQIAGRTYATEIGEVRLVRLEDGSRLRLDTDSKVRVRLAGNARRIDLLSGRAQFEVAHDEARPFVVQAGETAVRALGTRFDVRREAAGVEVVLFEGSVEVDGPGEAASPLILRPGETARLPTGAQRPVVLAAAAPELDSWTSGRLVFRSTPLGEAADEVNRYSPVKVVIEDARLAATPVTGVFDAGDTAAFVDAVRDLYGLQAASVGEREIRLRPST